MIFTLYFSVLSHTMKACLKIIVLILVFSIFQRTIALGQQPKMTPEMLGYWITQTTFQKDTVNLVIVSMIGEQQKKKPIILIEKGSLPTPLIIEHDEWGMYPIMPFDTRIFTENYHLVFVSKPGVPVKVNKNKLTSRLEYNDPKTGLFPQFYQERNHKYYYVNRDAQVLKFLKKQPWVDKSRMVIAGHSEGGHIMAKLATVSKDVTHVISSSENPFGQMATIIHSSRPYDDSTKSYTNETFDYWEKLMNESSELEVPPGFTLEQQYKYQYGFNQPAFNNFQKIKVPVLVTYGTKDHCAPYNDYMRIAMTRD